MREAEPIAPKSRTREHFGAYLPLIDDMAKTLAEAMAGQESDAAVVEVMRDYWAIVRRDPRYRDLAAAVDAADVAKLGDSHMSPNGNGQEIPRLDPSWSR